MTDRPIPEHDDASAPFWAFAARHELRIQRCASCAAFRHPPRPACPSCGSLEADWARASGRGTVWSWVVAHPPVLPAFAERAPYNVVVVELEEGVRMIGNLLDVANGAIAAGMPVVVAFEDLTDGGDGTSLPQWRRA